MRESLWGFIFTIYGHVEDLLLQQQAAKLTLQRKRTATQKSFRVSINISDESFETKI